MGHAVAETDAEEEALKAQYKYQDGQLGYSHRFFDQVGHQTTYASIGNIRFPNVPKYV